MDEAENLSSTEDVRASREDSQKSFSLLHPPKIGRYTILRRLGKGGFGEVFLAFDDELDRPVAIKVPHRERITQPEDIEVYLTEARVVASLDHPHIVPVFDAGRTDDGLCFVVSKLIEGSDLATRIKEARLGFHESAALVATIAEALHFAHTKGLVHRDIKPGNILIDLSGKAFVADFGLALKEEDFGSGARIAGTPAFMSPEQARGEGHRVDGRSDVFSLGVVFYELLTGRRPFIAKAQNKIEARNELMDLIATTEARPPRQIDDTIPKELERICQKAMSKRATERYSTAKDMAEDLQEFLKTAGVTVSPVVPAVSITIPPGSTQEVTPIPSTSKQSDSDQRPIKVVPKGLRSFDEDDADFYLELLPGPRDRDGLPESIRFWKRKIEQIDPDETFKVGLIYGPSGCGKSSLVKAGLLPRLAKHVHSLYIEATPEETESRLLKGVRKACPVLPQGLGLVKSLASLRRGRVLPREHKVLIVLDQFEQWLHARPGKQNTELVSALRHCDGEHVQAIVLVRDDFWMAATRFMRNLEIRLLEGENSAAVDLFDLDHARKVLVAFGRAFGKLPENATETLKDQKEFLKESVNGLAEEGKVISVRLTLFAEMMKGKPWTPATLREVGGTKGVGVTFLEETFSASTAPPEHRFHQKAAQSVLKALLPESGADIKGQMRSRQELLEASGYVNRPRDFNDLIHILDPELRLITPTDPEGSASEGQQTTPSGQYYVLAHDYLVHSLRDWLTRKQRETRRGRAELRLAERSALWNAKPENRHLPSALEWTTIRLLTQKKDWAEPQRRMMKRAGRVHGLRTLGALIFASLISWAALDGYGRLRASSLVESLQKVGTPDVPTIVKQLSGYRRWADPQLVRVVQSTDDQRREHLHASLALLTVDATQVDYLFSRLLSATPSELPVLRDALSPHRSTLTPRLWTTLEPAKPGDVTLLPVASALAVYDPENTKWKAVEGKVAQSLVSVNSVFLGMWLEALRPVRGKLTIPLAKIFRDKERTESERTQATNILADYASDDRRLIADLIMDADSKTYATLFPIAERHAADILPLFRAEIGNRAISGDIERDSELVKDKRVERQARAAIALVRMGKAEEVWQLLRHSADPRVRSFILNWLSPLGADPRNLVTELDQIDPNAKPTPTQGQQLMDAILFHPETSMRRALILALGTYGTEGLSPGEREPLTGKHFDLYRNDPDSGIHGAVAWTLRKWGQQVKLTEADAQLMKLKDRGDRRWLVNSQGQTFAVIEGPVEFRMGSPPTEPDRFPQYEIPHRQIIPRRFAIATQEVSVKQYQVFVKENPGVDHAQNDSLSPDPDGPMNQVSWYDAAAYCNWLSRREGRPECYEPNKEGKYWAGMKIKPDALRLSGYRLPTEAEWEYACRAGTGTSRYYGVSEDLLGRYAWYIITSQNHAGLCGSLLPNDLGLFDMLGNMWEWCHDEFHQVNDTESQFDDISIHLFVNESNPRFLRGGSFINRASFVRSALRFGDAPAYRLYFSGFRPSRTYP